MEAGKKAIRCLIISNSQTFLKEITKNLNNYPRGFDIRSSNNPSNIKNLIFYLDLAIIEDDYIHQTEENVLVDLISFLHASQISVILLNDFKRKLPDFIARRSDFIRFVSKSASNQEFNFVLDEIDYQLRNKGQGNKSSHDKYLEAIIQIQNMLLTKMPLETKIKEVMKLVGITAGASRVAIFENKHDSKGKFLMTLRFEWLNTRHITEQDHPMFKVMPYQPNFNRWASALSAGKVISGYVHKFPNSEQPLLKTLGAQNLLLLPINFKGHFWGFMLISVNRQQRLWEKEELPYLKSIVSPISSYLELKQEEDKKEPSNTGIDQLLRDSNIGLFISNREGNITSCNRSFSKMIGYTDQIIQNLNLKVLTSPDDFAKEVPLIKKLLSGEIPSYIIEKRFLAKGNQSVWVKVQMSSRGQKDSKPNQIIGLVENITGLKEAEKALSESEERSKILTNISFEGIALISRDVVVECNQRLLEISGYTRSEIIGNDFIDLFVERSAKALLKTRIKNKEKEPFVTSGTTKTGEKIQVEVEFRNTTHLDESLTVIAFRDVTFRKNSEQEIRKLNSAINQSPSSIVITDNNGVIGYVNEAFCEVTGYSKEEIIGEKPSILKSGYHNDTFYQNLWETIRRGETWEGVFKNKTKDGGFIWERAIISPFFDEQKNITHYLAIMENITKEKETREALEESEERHRIIAELTNDFVYSAVIHDSKITIKWRSGSMEKLSGYEIHEINDKAIGWYSIINEDDLEKIVFPSIINLPREKTQNFEYRITTKDNREKWVSDKLRLINDDIEDDKLIVVGAIQDITLRKTANIALDQSKKYLDSIIDNLPIGLQIFDDQGYATRMNETQRKLFGIKNVDEIKGSFNILSDPFSKAGGSDQVFKEVYERKTTVNHEKEIDFDRPENHWETRKGKLTINEIIFPILKNDGKVHSVISISSDISQRVETEKALKTSEMNQKALLRLIPDLIFVLTEDGIFKDVYTEDNDKLLLPAGDFLNKSFSDIFPETLSTAFYENLRNAVKSREMQSFHYELEIDGKPYYFETRLLVSKEKEVIAIIRDITENTVAERTIKDSEEKFRELAERTQDTLILMSASNEILYVSPNLEKILGISAEKYTDNPIKVLRLIHPDDRGRVIPELNLYRKNKYESIDLQFRVVLENEEIKWLWYRENTIFNQNHEPVRYASVMTDITSNKLAEQELKEAKEEAEKAYRSKSVFLANMSHEIRTPMNAVLGFTDLLYSRINDPVLKGYLNSIKSSGNTLLNLLNDILDLSKIEAEKMRILQSPVNLFTVFEEVKHIFSLKALEKGLDYSFKIDKNIPESLLLDELRLKQILLNLIDNAIKFTEKGEIKVKAKLIGDQDDGKVDLLISVEDTGIGVPESMQETIFESFRQQDDQDKKKYKGTGLGLAITKRLVELFKGTLKLKSKPDKGSKFEVILTDIEISDPIIIPVADKKKKLSFDKSTLEDKVIVLVDEQKTNRDLIKEVFNNSESKVIEGESVESILDKVTQKVDLFILEMKNPGSVLEDLILINNNSRLKNAAKIGVTSTSEFNLEPKILAAFKTILTKPIQLDRFVEIVDDHFNQNDSKNNGSVYPDDIVDFRILNEVIKLLKGDLHKKWQSATDTSSFAEIEQFAQVVKEVGTEYRLDALNTFSDVLTMHVKNFDIDRMTEVLNTYPSIIKELKGNLKNLTSDN